MNNKIKENQYQVDSKNVYMLRRSSALAALLSLLLLFGSYSIATISKNRFLYAGMAVVFTGMYLLSRVLCRKHEKGVLPLCYLFWTIAYCAAIELGTRLTPDQPATTFCVLIFALPMLFIDIPQRVDGLLIVVCILFGFRTWQIKPQEIAALDIVNVVSFLFLSIFVNRFVLQSKVSDIDNQKKILWQRDRDSLTKIYNRQAAENIICDYMKNTDKPAVLMVIDIDDFKQVNDNMGHQRGDEVIRLVAESITNELRESDVVGRFGGDEFIAFMLYVKNTDTCTRKAEEIIGRLKMEIEKRKFEQGVSISIGMASYPKDAADYTELFQKADAALYHAKRKGKNRACCISEEF